jgi:hypothetical protein
MNKKVLSIILPLLIIAISSFVFAKYQMEISNYLVAFNFAANKFLVGAIAGLVLSAMWAWERKLLASKLMYISIPSWLVFAVAGNLVVLEGVVFLTVWSVIAVSFGLYANRLGSMDQ